VTWGFAGGPGFVAEFGTVLESDLERGVGGGRVRETSSGILFKGTGVKGDAALSILSLWNDHGHDFHAIWREVVGNWVER